MKRTPFLSEALQRSCESVDLVEPEEGGQIRLVNIFGEQKIIKGKLKSMNLVNHKILFEE